MPLPSSLPRHCLSFWQRHKVCQYFSRGKYVQANHFLLSCLGSNPAFSQLVDELRGNLIQPYGSFPILCRFEPKLFRQLAHLPHQESVLKFFLAELIGDTEHYVPHKSEKLWNYCRHEAFLYARHAQESPSFVAVLQDIMVTAIPRAHPPTIAWLVDQLTARRLTSRPGEYVLDCAILAHTYGATEDQLLDFFRLPNLPPFDATRLERTFGSDFTTKIQSALSFGTMQQAIPLAPPPSPPSSQISPPPAPSKTLRL